MNKNTKRKMVESRKERQTGKPNIATPRPGRKLKPQKLEKWQTDAEEYTKRVLKGESVAV